MNNAFNRLLGRSTPDTAPLALPAPKSAPKDEKKIAALRHFEKARFSDRCRTIGFINAARNGEWMAGQADGNSERWTIRKVTEEPNITGDAKPVGEPALTYKVIKDNLCFHEMIQYLSDYERGQKAFGLPPVEDEAISDHFQKIAENEGMIFDTSGAPHPTLNGEIVTDGTFAKADIERLRAYSKKNSARFFDGNDLISHFINPAQKMGISFTGLIEKSTDLHTLHEVAEGFDDLKKILSCLFKKDSWPKDMSDILTCNYTQIDKRISELEKYHQKDDFVEPYNERLYSARRSLYRAPEGNVTELKDLYSLIKKYSAVSPEDCFKKIQDKLKPLIPALPCDADRIKTISTILDATQLYFDVMKARYYLGPFNPNSSNYINQLKQIQAHLPEYRKAFKKLGAGNGDLWKLESAILDNEMPGSLSALHRLASELTSMEQAMREGLQRDKNAVVAGPYLG